MKYVCAKCGEHTEKGSLIAYKDGTGMLVALCAKHQNELRKQMVADGVPVERADRMN